MNDFDKMTRDEELPSLKSTIMWLAIGGIIGAIVYAVQWH